MQMKRGYCRSCLGWPRRVVLIDPEWGECIGCYYDGPIILESRIKHPNQTTIFEIGRWG